MPAPSPLDALAEELGAVAGRIEREATLRIDAAIAEVRRIDAERELRLTNLERAVADRLATVRDGRDGIVGPPGVAGPVGPQGASPTADEVAAIVVGAVKAAALAAVAAIPAPRDGRDGRDAEPVTNAQIAAAVAEHLAANPPPAGPKVIG